MARRRKPRQDQTPPPSSRNPTSPPADLSNKLFIWNTEKVDLDSEYGWNKATIGIVLQKIIPKLQHFGSMTWEDVKKTGSHFIDLDKCSKEAEDRLGEIELEVEQLFSLRIDGEKRIFGWRQASVFYVLWWDPEHKVCPSQKKGT